MSSLFDRFLNILSLILNIFGLIISFLILIRIYIRRKSFNNIKSLLCINNYILIFILSIVVLLQNIDVFKRDSIHFIIQNETFACRIKGYINFSLLSSIYQAFILQALFRLDRIVHRSNRWLNKLFNYLIIIPILWLISFILMSPLIIFHSQKLILKDNICFILKDDSLSILYSMLIIYVIPFLFILFIYIRVSIYIHKQSKLIKEILIKKSYRDIIILRRIIIIIILLFSYGFPTSIMLIHLGITNKLLSCFYRFLLLSISLCVFTQSIILIYLTPYFQRNIFYFKKKQKKYLNNQIKSSQIKTNTTRSTSSSTLERSL